jgi:hypothetical protein
MNRKQRRAQAKWQRAGRAVDAGPVPDLALLAELVDLGLLTPADAESLSEPNADPGRALIMTLAERGLMTPADAEALDAWAGALATERVEGRLDDAERDEQIVARLKRDLARRGRA